ncbi:MAG: glycerophosphodiester phosphodiesterase family protein [Planctomycetota bacterium]
MHNVFCVVALFALMPATHATAESGKPIVVAHRGASAYAPENTLAAFNLAWKLGADAAEGDFHLTADGQIVCCHDETTERTAGRRLVIAESTLQSLRSLDVGTWKHKKFRGERIETLSDVLATVPAGKLFYVELKGGPEVIPSLVDAITKSDPRADRVRVIAFDIEVVRAAKHALPSHEAYWLSSLHRDDNGRRPRGYDAPEAGFPNTLSDKDLRRIHPRLFACKRRQMLANVSKRRHSQAGMLAG